jgi:3-oxoacyl-[acyl-carrier protein] reductase
MQLTNQVAVVTGAAGAGIGQTVARTLASEGANVVVSDAHPKRCLDVAADIKKNTGVETLGIQCDVSNSDNVNTMIKKVIEKFGRIDILVNNAGINKLSKVVDMTDETWDLVVKVNLFGTFYCSRAVLPSMIKQKQGRIVSLSSVAGWIAEGDGQSHYCAAKAAIMSFTRCLAKEVAQHNIRVNAIAPGVIWNEFLARIYPQETTEQWPKSVPLGRVGQPIDIAKVVLFLVTEASGYVTGETICVSGGLFMPY